MDLLIRRILLTAVAAGALTVAGAAPALAVTAAAGTAIAPVQAGDDDGDDDDDDDDDDDRGRAPVGGVATGSGGWVAQSGDDDDDDDNGRAPAGGVQAGAGGTAGVDPAIWGVAAGAAALTGGAALVGRRFVGRSTDGR